MIQGALQRTGGNQCAASKHLGIHRNTLQCKITRYGLSNDRKPASRERRPLRRRKVR